MTEEPPESPADPRPNNRPYYRDENCDECGEELVLLDEVKDLDREPWHDEFCCPNEDCETHGNLYLDWPQAQWDELNQRIEETKEEDYMTLEEVEEDLDLEDEDDG